jgi:hypothetical protein
LKWSARVAATRGPNPDFDDYLWLSRCTISEIVTDGNTRRHLHIPVTLKGQRQTKDIAAMVDSGASTAFLSKRFVETHLVRTRELSQPVVLLNIDGTPNRAGSITHTATLNLKIGDHEEMIEFVVTDLGPEDVVLGIEWLRQHNPDINWSEGKLNFSRCPATCAPEEEPTPGSPPNDFERLTGNRRQRRAWLRAGLVQRDEEVWAAAGYTYAREQGTPLWASAGYTHSQKIAEAEHAKKRTQTFEEMVPEHYRGFSKVFSEADFSRLPDHQPWDHAIDLKPDTPETLQSKVYPMSPNEQGELDKFISDNLRSGMIRASKSPMAAPVFFIKKKDGSLRLIEDYRKLNLFTVKNRYPLPLASDIINRLAGARYFTKLDVRWGYHNIRIKEGDEWNAAFVTNRGLFEPTVMLFRLTNAPATFQALMNTIFADLIASGKVAVYLDDILIYTSTLEEHRRVVQDVLDRLQKRDLYLRPEKCEFEKETVEYLGMVISQGEVRMDTAKVQAIKDWPAPTNLHDLRGFVGFANFYRRFIQDFSKICRPLHDLTKKDTPWVWNSEHQHAFDTLRNAFIASPVLSMWEPDRPTRLEVDASGYATGGVISQKGDDGTWHPIAYRSEGLNEAERNYMVEDREMLAIIRALEEWRHFLEGLPAPFEILTDHNNLRSWSAAKDLSRRQARWAQYLTRFDFVLVHRPGKDNGRADALSRRANHRISDSDDNRGVTVLKPEQFVHHLAATGEASVLLDTALTERVRQSSVKEAEVLTALSELGRDGPKRLANGLPEWDQKDGLVWYRGKLYIPNDEELRSDVVATCHDSITAGHPGQYGTQEHVERHYWWPQLAAFVKRYVDACDLCNRTKTSRLGPQGELQPLPVPGAPWEVISTNMIVELPKSNGYDSIVAFVDYDTKQCHLAPTVTTATADDIADIEIREVFRLHGLQKKILSDRGPQFAAKLLRRIYERLGIEMALSTAYHPQTDGQTERLNAEIEQFLRLFCSWRQDDWEPLLPIVEFVLNSRVHSATKHTPFELNYGFTPDFTIPAGGKTDVPAATERLDRLREARQEAHAALRITREHMKFYHDRNVRPTPDYPEGSKVWLDSRNVKLKQPSQKLGHKWLGPFVIEKKVGNLAYRLKLPHQMKVHPVFHVNLLKPHKPDTIPGREPPEPPPIETEEGEEEWEVDKVLDSRLHGRWKKLQYLVSWKGYASLHNSWEPAENVENAPERIAEFHRKNPGAPRRLAATLFATLPWARLENFTDMPLPAGPGWEDGKQPGVIRRSNLQ